METMLKPYSEYHRIDLPWQQLAPAHWMRLRLKHLLREVDERTQTGEEPLMSLTRSRGLVRRSEITDKPPSAKTLIGYKVCRPGDIVMNRMQAWSGMFGLASEVGLVSPDYAVLRLLGEANGGFLLSLLKAPGPVSHFAALSTGMGSGFNRLYTDQLGAVSVATPPHEEQVQVAKVIRDIDRRVNRLIRVKQRLIALLNEQKQAIIQRAVTRGLDPDVTLKPSGVDWLGDVPEHWEVQRLKAAIADHANGIWGDDPDGHNDTICVRVADFDWFKRRVDISNPTLRSVSPSQRSGRLLNPGDLLIEKSGGGDLTPVGRVVLYDHDAPAVCSNFVARIRPRRDVVLPGYLCLLFYMLHFAGRNILAIKQTTGIQNLDAGSYFAEAIPLPPISEQEAILNEMEVVVNRIDASIKTASDEIFLIREYRTRLIADVVTGKLDVRGVAVPEVEGDGAAVEMDVAEDDETILDEEALAMEDET